MTPNGDYQLHIARILALGEAAEPRQGAPRHIDRLHLRGRVRYAVVTLPAEAFEAAVWCWKQLKNKKQRTRA